MTTTTPAVWLAESDRPPSALKPAPGLPPRQGIVLAVLWDATGPLTAAQISAYLPTPGISHALSELRSAGLVSTSRVGHTQRYQAALNRDDYLAGLIAAALEHASDPTSVLCTALHTTGRVTNLTSS